MRPEKSPVEPSLDEILASIRQIISDDSKGKPKGLPDEDILDLTNLLPDEDSYSALSKEKETSSNTQRPKAERVQPFSKNSLEGMMGSQSTLSDTAQALHALSQLAQEKQQTREPRPSYQTVGREPIENLIHDILRPLLKEWLDANLPLLVRWVVNEKVEKIMRQKNLVPFE